MKTIPEQTTTPQPDTTGHLTLHVLGSGSKGNASVLMGPEGALLVDCGFSRKEVLKRMQDLSLDPSCLKAILVTHEHTDHTKGIDVLSRKLDIPVYATAGTLRARCCSPFLARSATFHSRDTVTLAGIACTTFPISHDAAEPVGFRFEYAGDAVGYATDTGYLTREAFELLSQCRILALESNHDQEMLQNGPYPYYLKQRIASQKGHLSNADSAKALADLLCNKLETIVGMHLSETNNLPEIPLDSLSGIVSRECHKARVVIASQGRPCTAK